MSAGTNRKQLLEPADVEQLLRGWLLHAHKARDRHEAIARVCESRRYWFGGAAVALSAISGSSVFASIGQNFDTGWVALVGIISIVAAVFAALQTFLDYPGRAAAHHVAAVKYKAIIRELEQVLTGPLECPPEGTADDGSPATLVSGELPGHGPIDIDWITDLRGRFDALEEATPVVDGSAWRHVEAAYAEAHLVDRAVDFGQPKVS